MNHQLTNNLIWIGYYLACILWIILAIFFLKGLIKKDWYLVKRVLKYIINSIVFSIAWMFILELALVVRPSILPTKRASIIALQNWINEKQIEDIYIALAVILLLVGVNLLFYFKIEQRKNKKDLAILTLSAIVILSFSIWLTGQDAYFGLLEEINRHFG